MVSESHISFARQQNREGSSIVVAISYEIYEKRACFSPVWMVWTAGMGRDPAVLPGCCGIVLERNDLRCVYRQILNGIQQ